MSVQAFSFDDGDTGDTPTPDDDGDQYHAPAPVVVTAPAPAPVPSALAKPATSSSSFSAGGASVASSAVEIPAPTPHHAAAPPPPPNFSQQHEAHSPAEVLSRIATFLRQRGIEEFDTYGDGAPALDAFEAEVARLLGFKEAVFFLTGTLAQQACFRAWLRVCSCLAFSRTCGFRMLELEQFSLSHSAISLSHYIHVHLVPSPLLRPRTPSSRAQIAIELHRADTKSPIVLAHPTAHLVHLTSLDNGVDQAREFAALAKANVPGADVRAVGALHRALTHQDVADCLGDEKKRWWQALQLEQAAYAKALEEHKAKQGMFGSVFGSDAGGPVKPAPLPAAESWRMPGTLLVELPQRMNGGATMPYADLVRTRAAAVAAGLRMHLDGARLWDVVEHYACPLKDVCQHFDSAYVSFYKGVGAMGGAMLLGDAQFCARARAMRHQRGGAAFTMLPIAAHAQMCLRDSLNLFGMRLDACRGMVGLVKSEAARLAYERCGHFRSFRC